MTSEDIKHQLNNNNNNIVDTRIMPFVSSKMKELHPEVE